MKSALRSYNENEARSTTVERNTKPKATNFRAFVLWAFLRHSDFVLRISLVHALSGHGSAVGLEHVDFGPPCPGSQHHAFAGAKPHLARLEVRAADDELSQQ